MKMTLFAHGAVLAAAVVATIPSTLRAGNLVTDYVLVFPHVVAGELGGEYLESVLFVANPTSDPIVLELQSNPDS